MKLPLLALCVALLAACEHAPERVSEQKPTVSYSYASGDQEQAKQSAAKYCYDHYGRSAQVTNDQPDGSNRVMTFECVPR
jgi:hypothetical protein